MWNFPAASGSWSSLRERFRSRITHLFGGADDRGEAGQWSVTHDGVPPVGTGRPLVLRPIQAPARVVTVGSVIPLLLLLLLALVVMALVNFGGALLTLATANWRPAWRWAPRGSGSWVRC